MSGPENPLSVAVAVWLRTPLHMASAYGVEALVERLVAIGADVNNKNSLSWTPLQVITNPHPTLVPSATHLLSIDGASVSCLPITSTGGLPSRLPLHHQDHPERGS